MSSSKITLLIVALTYYSIQAYSQNLLDELQQESSKNKTFTVGTFKGTRVVNGHSIETKGKGELELIISHRFGTLNSGSFNFWGLDAAYIRIGLEYGITDRLGIGIGRNSFNKIYDSYLKYKILAQGTGNGSIPFSLTAFTSASVQTYPQKEVDPTLTFGSRLAYTYQLLIAKKFNSKLSLQISPTVLHVNRVDQTILSNDQYALGISGRYKLTKSLAINGEYIYRIDPLTNSPYYNCLGIGFDIETGGHVFQLIFSNTQGMVERTFINETAGDFLGGDIHFGFNITRTFQLKHPK